MNRSAATAAPPTSGGTTSAEATSQTEHFTRLAHTILAACDFRMGQSSVSRLVRRFQYRVECNGWNFFDYFANAMQMTAEQRRQALANPDLARCIGYSDPTGEQAVNNVMKGAQA